MSWMPGPLPGTTSGGGAGSQPGSHGCRGESILANSGVGGWMKVTGDNEEPEGPGGAAASPVRLGGRQDWSAHAWLRRKRWEDGG